MFFNIALFGALLLAPVVLAVPSGFGADITRRGQAYQSQANSRVEEAVGVFTNYSNNWAGAVWAEPNGTFRSVVGTFTVPTPSGSDGSSASVWVGIDGDTCHDVVLQTGISMIAGRDGPAYFAWYEWYPDIAYNYTDIGISAGDEITLTVWASSNNTGVTTITNLSTGQTEFKNLGSTSSLCGQNAEWIVEDYMHNNRTVPFTDFGTVTFTDAVAFDVGLKEYHPSGATILDIEQNKQVLTSVTTDETSVKIEYV